MVSVVLSRRSVSRNGHSTSPATSVITSRNFSYSQKLNNSCLFSRSRAYRPEHFLNILEVVRSDINDIRTEMMFNDCQGMTLTSLTGGGEGEVENTSLHLSFTNILAHLFVMKMDWLLSPGLPCLPVEKEMRVRLLHTRLIQSWRNMNCVFLSRRNISESERAVLLSNLNRVLDTEIMRYSTCPERQIRDCVLMEAAVSTLRQSQSYLSISASTVLLR